MLKYRLLLGPPLVLLLVGVVWLDQLAQARWGRPGIVFTLFMLGIGVEAARELTKIFRARSIITSFGVNALAVSAGMLAGSLSVSELGHVNGAAILGSVASLVLIGALLFYARGQNVDGVVASGAAAVMAFVYLGVMGGFLILIVKAFGGWTMIGVVLVTKGCDIGAYGVGRSIGRHKLIPWLSPGKTWEGFAGGVASSSLAGLAWAWASYRWPGALQPDLVWWQGLALGALFGALGQAGDLLASLFKRDAGMKDYSRALPGFGGVIDVADSPLLVAPVAYWVLLIMG